MATHQCYHYNIESHNMKLMKQHYSTLFIALQLCPGIFPLTHWKIQILNVPYVTSVIKENAFQKQENSK